MQPNFRYLVVILAVLLPGLAAAQGGSDADPKLVKGSGLPYVIAVEGADGDLKDLLLSQSRLKTLQDRPPATALGLRRRAESDALAFIKALEAEGYYGASVRHEIDATESPARVTLIVDRGPRYTLTSFSITYEGDADQTGELPRDGADSGVEIGQPARASVILQAIDALSIRLRTLGHPFVSVPGHTARVDHAARTMDVTVRIDPGPAATFGPTVVSGLESIDEDYIRLQIPWKAGDPYDQRKVQSLRKALLGTGLFSTVLVDGADAVTEDGTLPTRISVTEAKHRSIGVGARFSTTLGPSVHAFWEHRNLFGADENLRPELTLGTVEQSFVTTFRKPDYLRKDQDLVAVTRASHEVLEAYDSTALFGSVGLERELSPLWTAGLGVEFEWAELTDEQGTKTSQLAGLPLTFRRDDTDSLLDPTEGTRLVLTASPYAGLYDGPTAFLKAMAEGSAYLSLDEGSSYVLAGRAAIGSLIGASRTGVPADRRYYSGGGGSLRGFGYQMAGDLDATNDPVGGKALLEAGVELRIKVTDTIGLVPFVEAGRAFTETTPSLDEGLFLGAGLGVRYYSAVGPIRFDVGVPLNGRSGVDDPFQVYISLGQAF